MLKRFEEKKSKYTCFGCDQPFTGGYYYALLGKLWHQHCFSCTKCGTALTEETGWCVMERKGCGGVGGEGRERGLCKMFIYVKFYVCGGCYPCLVQSTNVYICMYVMGVTLAWYNRLILHSHASCISAVSAIVSSFFFLLSPPYPPSLSSPLSSPLSLHIFPGTFAPRSPYARSTRQGASWRDGR